jgi:hypothetical protein
VTAAPIPPLALLAVLALVTAGCGGSSDKKANAAYADSVCSAVGTWEQQIESITSSGFTGGISKASLQAKITQAQTATKTLATQIKAVPPPNTSDGQAAKQQIDQLSAQLTTTVNSAKSAVASIPANASAATVAAAIIPLAPQLTSLGTTAQTTLKSVQTAKGGLSSAFKSSSACKNLGSA